MEGERQYYPGFQVDNAWGKELKVEIRYKFNLIELVESNQLTRRVELNLNEN